MFKQIVAILALCTISQALSSRIPLRYDGSDVSGSDGITTKLYITDDVYLVDFVNGYKSYSSDEMKQAGYLIIAYNNDNVVLENEDCSPDYYSHSDFEKADPEASRLLNSSIDILDKTLKDSSKKSISLTVEGATVTIDQNHGFPEPQKINSKGYDITVLTKGHCIVKGQTKVKGFETLITSKHTIVTVMENNILNEGRGCVFDKDTQELLADVRAIAKDC